MYIPNCCITMYILIPARHKAHEESHPLCFVYDSSLPDKLDVFPSRYLFLCDCILYYEICFVK